jgi:DNA-binding NarL/FixJ family response regulator
MASMVIAPAFKAQPGDRRVDRQTREILATRFEPDAAIHFEGDGTAAWGTKCDRIDEHRIEHGESRREGTPVRGYREGDATGMTTGMPLTPVRVAAVNDYELILAGLEQLLRGYPDKIVVCDRIVAGEPIDEPVDVALFDLYGRHGVAATTLRLLADDEKVEHVAVFSLELGPDLVAEGRAAGASAFISKALPAGDLVDALVRIAKGEGVIAALPRPHPAMPELTWPGQGAGLTERESQTLVLLADGLPNREIAAALFLSAETVKSYLARIFQKLEVRNRTQAAAFVHRSPDFR